MKNLVVQVVRASLFFTGLMIIYEAGRDNGIKEGIRQGRVIGKMEAGIDLANIMLGHNDSKNEVEKGLAS